MRFRLESLSFRKLLYISTFHYICGSPKQCVIHGDVIATYIESHPTVAVGTIIDHTDDTGAAHITITGGTIGINGHENGMVFGSSRGEVAAPGEIHDRLAWVYDTHVTIGTAGQGTTYTTPQIKGSLYGSGENGHTYNNAEVIIHSGMIGITDTSIDGGAVYGYRGNVYGGGCGTDTYWVDANSNGTEDEGEQHYNPLSGIVRGIATVTIDGGQVVRNVYGGGAMGSVGNEDGTSGKTTINISGGIIGHEGLNGEVFGASRGNAGISTVASGLAQVRETEVNILPNADTEKPDARIWNNVYGGGQAGVVRQNVNVSVSGGQIDGDVYGGGALADTNTDNWDGDGSTVEYVAVTGLVETSYRVKEVLEGESVTGLFTYNGSSYDPATGTAVAGTTYYERLSGAPVAGYYYYNDESHEYEMYTKSTDFAETEKTYYKKKVAGRWKSGFNNESTGTTYKTNVSLTGGLIGNAYGGGLGNTTTAANVYGDVTITVNKGVTDATKGVTFIQRTEQLVIDGIQITTPTSGRVFGCNNHNGTPTGNVEVHVYATRQIDEDNKIIAGHGSSERKYSYEIQSVYGGGNQADYLPAEGKKSQVIIEGCEDTSIEKVYGGGNSAVIPETDVLIKGAYDIGYAFGGGNGDKPIKKADGTWTENEGAIVIGMAKIVCQGGKIGQVFGGGDSKGSCGYTSATTKQEGTCPLHITRLYGAGNKGDVSAVNIVLGACSDNAIEYVHGGSYNAHVTGDVHLTITSGILKNVYGGNDARGGIGGSIIVDIEETNGCNPIIIQNLVGGGNEAPYPGTYSEGVVEKPYTTRGKITVNVKSATRIDNIYGGSFMAEADADTEVNINMIKGIKAGETVTIPKEFSYIPNISGISNNADGKSITCTINDAIGTIGNVYGGGNQGLVKGDTKVNICTLDKVSIMQRDGSGKIQAKDKDDKLITIDEETGSNNADLTILYNNENTVLGANITGNVYGGGNLADVSTYTKDKEDVEYGGNTQVNICFNPETHATVAEGSEKVKIAKSVYGGGNQANVYGNTQVTMSDGYVFNGIFGGGYSGSVGTFTTSTAAEHANIYGHTTHTGCIGKPISCKDGTGTCTVVVNGGQIGPVTVASQGMPVPQGWVWGGGCGLVEDPAANPDTHFKTYVNKTDVTIGGTAFIMEGVIGGGEFGRVLGNTSVTIKDHCQIGVGEGEYYKDESGNPTTPKRYTDGYDYGSGATTNQFIDPTVTAVTDGNKLADCSHWPFKSPYLPYDPYFDESGSPAEYAPASTAHPSDGKTWIGVVFGGGSGYMPYKKSGGSGYDWCRSAGWVEGDTKVLISGGHILTNVYGGNEYTDVKGKCTVKMTGGTIGIPRTLEQIAVNPLTGYLFGAGKGDQRSHFNTMNNVGSVEVEVSGGIIYGSVFGGAEDGHVLGDVKVDIKPGAIIGTWGTSYVDGNVFGGGRGFSGTSLTAGSVEGNVAMTISGGTILGSVYGGGRMASVGIDFLDTDTPAYGQLIDDTDEDENGVIEPSEKHGHVTIDISGGTIGNANLPADGTYSNSTHSGNVFGGCMGRLTLLDGTTNALWPKMAITKTTTINISGGADIKRNVYGGSEYGIVRNQATVNVAGGTVEGSVFGGGYGSTDNTSKTTLIPAGYESAGVHFTFYPILWAGCVSGNTEVNVSGGTVGNCVYGGGELASVGLINFNSDEAGKFNNIIKHESLTDGFGLSWPYKFEYIHADPKDTTKDGKATVNITGGTIGTKDGSGNYVGNTGYIYGGCKGKVSFGATDDIEKQRYTEAFIANVRETEVNIGKSGITDNTTPVIRTAYGGGEDGHVIENANVTVYHGKIDRSVFGGGMGTSTFTTTLLDPATGNPKGSTEAVHSWTAGKVYGNTSVTMYGGTVGWFIFGGGNMASVGKGNYAGGSDDYLTAGYGETLSGSLWTNTDFLNSGKSAVTILGGTVGTETSGVHPTYGIPYGSIFGGSRGQAARDISTLSNGYSNAYKYVPDFFTGYVNKATVNIGGTSSSAPSTNTPVIYGCIYGGGQDGHVRNSTEVNVFKGNINKQTGDGADRSGNVFGAGSGIGTYEDGSNKYCSSTSGSVTGATLVEVYDGASIQGNVYGGGALASVGPAKIGTANEQKEASEGHASYSRNLVNVKGGSIGGSVYGASRGPGSTMFSGVNPAFTGVSSKDDATADKYNPTKYATSVWTEVNVTGGTIGDNVYGGGEMGQVKESTLVRLTGGVIAHDAYGGGQGTIGTNAIAADVGGNTTVELNGFEDADGTVTRVSCGVKGCVVNKVFGCNDLNGTPKGHSLVHVYATQHKSKDNISQKIAPPAFSPNQGKSEGYKDYLSRIISEATKTGGLASDATVITDANTLLTVTLKDVEEASLNETQKTSITTAANNIINALLALFDYDVDAVYGGGDLAPYEPTGALERAEVIIEGCDVTSIRQVYGGGNAASVQATDLKVQSVFIIDELYGGGNGLDNYQLDGVWYQNPGANVGYKDFMHYVTDESDVEHNGNGDEDKPFVAIMNTDADTPEEREESAYRYGLGEAKTTITGGHIHTVYGGSNHRGNISTTALSQYQESGDCPLVTDKTYGGSKDADMDGQIEVVLDCVENGGTYYGGSQNANIYGNVNVNITNGTYERVFGGNDMAGTIGGVITINIEEKGCTPIIIDELYGGGYLAPYSVWGYKKDSDGNYVTEEAKKEDGSLLKDKNGNQIYQRQPASQGELGARETPRRDPYINIISATKIGKIFGGGYKAKVIGSPHINVNMQEGRVLSTYANNADGSVKTDFAVGTHNQDEKDEYTVKEHEAHKDAYLAIGEIGEIYGGGNLADVQGNTYVEIGTGSWYNYVTQEVEPITRNAATITGNVFGGGKGDPNDGFYCMKAMVGKSESGKGSTNVVIGNGTIGGSVYGGGEVGRVEEHTSVTIGLEGNTTNELTIAGNVFGAGKGLATHGFSALTYGHSTVTVQGKAKVLGSVYGGGEKASVGKYKVYTGTETDAPAGTPLGWPYGLESGGICTVTVKDDAEIGPDDMVMHNTTTKKPDNSGHVFGAGMGVTPYEGVVGDPWRKNVGDSQSSFNAATYETAEAAEAAYLNYLETLALASETHVTVGGNAFVKGSVFGGSENGRVQTDTHVIIQDNCQIGNGYAQVDDDGKYLDELASPVTPVAINRRYTAKEWEEGHLFVEGDPEIALSYPADPADPTDPAYLELKAKVDAENALRTAIGSYYKHSLPECTAWKFGRDTTIVDGDKSTTTKMFLPYDPYGDGASSNVGCDGTTFNGNVFGGGSGYFPYAKGKWHWGAGHVGGNAVVEIKGGHVLSNVYGGNELTSVAGSSTVTMTGGTVGVPLTIGQVINHPISRCLYGGGKGDPRVAFNKQTNVQNTEVNVLGGTVYGSVFGGGEDGHVMRNTSVTIGNPDVSALPKDDPQVAGPTIGTFGTTYVEGNVFGGGRGFTGEAYTAGNVAGAVTLTINRGTMLGSVYCGGRLASVGYGLYASSETEGGDKYGMIQDDGYGDYYWDESEKKYKRETIEGFKRGHIEVTINGGTIGNEREYIVPSGANITAAGISETDVSKWKKETEADSEWNTWKAYHHIPGTGYVYDSDLGIYRLDHTCGGNVFAGGMGRLYELDGTTPIHLIDWWKLGNVKSTKLTIRKKNEAVDTRIKGSVYGGCELGWVQGKHQFGETSDDVATEILIEGGEIGSEVKDDEGVTRSTYGSVYGGGRGNKLEELFDAEDETKVTDNPKFTAGRVVHSTQVRMEGGTVMASVYGGGEVGNVGLGFSYGELNASNKDHNKGVTANVTITGGEIGKALLVVANDVANDTIRYGGGSMGNVYGGCSGDRTIVRCGTVFGNANVTISGGKIHHNVYGGGAYGTVGDFAYETEEDQYTHTIKVKSVKSLHTDGTGKATVTITDGTIGDDGRNNGMVFGSSRGEVVDNYVRDDYMAWVNDTHVTIGKAAKGTEGEEGYEPATGPTVHGSVYGGGENGHVLTDTKVDVHYGTIGNKDEYYPYRGNVYGAGCGTDYYMHNGEKRYYPWAGIVRGNTNINIDGGLITGCVYGAGAMASVGTVGELVDDPLADPADAGKKIVHVDTLGVYKHTDENSTFALSWPYEFKFVEGTGTATVNITGGHVGIKGTDGGDVYGSARGDAFLRYMLMHHAYVNNTVVNVDLPRTADVSELTDVDAPCITGSVHGSGENGYVYGDTKVTLRKGLIGHSLYGAGKGKGTYKYKLLKIGATPKTGTTDEYDDDQYVETDIYSLISGKVFGNTYVNMSDGHVVRNVYGGGNIASVGKGNYASGADDYYPDGYGERIEGNLWDGVSDDSKAFLESGNTVVEVIGGRVGYISEDDPGSSMKDGLPYGNVFGGSSGEAAPNIFHMPRFAYSPAFFSGYVNETSVTIGGYRCTTAYGDYKVGDGITAEKFKTFSEGDAAKWTKVGPTILASVYGGGQDGHVRRDTHVTVDGGEIGLAYNSANRSLVGTDKITDLNKELENAQWLLRGNVFGAGSGINLYKYDFNYDGEYDESGTEYDYKSPLDGSIIPMKEVDYSNSAGSVTGCTQVDINGGTIHRNVYGGGSLASVGPPLIPLTRTDMALKKDDTSKGRGWWSQNTVNIAGPVGTPTDYQVFYGGEVYGASRGMAGLDPNQFGTSFWTLVKVKNGAQIMGSVYGGGDNGIVRKDTDVRIGE